eukprot:6212707-Pleurochrysis_carterae.AAC.1
MEIIDPKAKLHLAVKPKRCRRRRRTQSRMASLTHCPSSRIPCAVLLDALSGGHSDVTTATAVSETSYVSRARVCERRMTEWNEYKTNIPRTIQQGN